MTPSEEERIKSSRMSLIPVRNREEGGGGRGGEGEEEFRFKRERRERGRGDDVKGRNLLPEEAPSERKICPGEAGPCPSRLVMYSATWSRTKGRPYYRKGG